MLPYLAPPTDYISLYVNTNCLNILPNLCLSVRTPFDILYQADWWCKEASGAFQALGC